MVQHEWFIWCLRGHVWLSLELAASKYRIEYFYWEDSDSLDGVVYLNVLWLISLQECWYYFFQVNHFLLTQRDWDKCTVPVSLCLLGEYCYIAYVFHIYIWNLRSVSRGSDLLLSVLFPAVLLSVLCMLPALEVLGINHICSCAVVVWIC